MAGITQTFTTAITNAAGQTVATEASIQTGDAEETFSVAVPGSGNVVVPITVDVSTLLSFWILVDGAGITWTHNDDGTPDFTQALTANVPYYWVTGHGANPLSVDITSFKLTKSGAGDATATGGFLTT